MPVKFKISGMEEFEVAMKKKGERIKSGLPECVSKSIDHGYKVATELVPQDTGHLKGTIQKKVTGLKGEVSTNERYAAFVEFGTAKHGAAQPYMRPAQKAAKGKMAELVKELVAKK